MPVFYDPADPSRAVLEPANRKGTFVPLAGAAIFALPGVAFYWLFFSGAMGG